MIQRILQPRELPGNSRRFFVAICRGAEPDELLIGVMRVW
jgi:hypothetical protein